VGYTRIETVGEGGFRGWSGNSDPRSNRIAREGGRKLGCLEVSDPEAAKLTVPETVQPGEIFLREQTRGFQDLLRQNPVSLFKLFG
jgi:hypothetical protein